MPDLTRTPTISPRSDLAETHRWINSIAVRGNFDWMPGVCGYVVHPVSTVTLGASYTDLMSFTFTPRVKCRILVYVNLAISATAAAPVVVYGSYVTPGGLSSSLTDPSPVTPSDYGISSLGTGVTSGRVSRTAVNSFDLAAGVTYSIIARAKSTGTGTATVRNPSMMTDIHFPLLTPAVS